MLVVATLLALVAPARPAATQGVTDLVLGALVDRQSNLLVDLTVTIAEREINAYLLGQNLPYRVRIVQEDVGKDPQRALAAVQRLAAQGIRVIIGPETSAQAAAILPYANANGIVLISYASTATSLAIPGDNLFRLVSDDSQQAVALTAYVVESGVTTIVPLIRDDVFGNDFVQEFTRAFGAAGGAVEPAVRYDPAATSFGPPLQTLNGRVEDASRRVGAGKVGVLLVAFEEVVSIFDAAFDYPALLSVRWFGTDGTAEVLALLDNPRAAQFAVTVDFPNSVYGEVGSLELYDQVASQVRAQTGLAPSNIALIAYDAVFLAALAAAAAGGISNLEAYKAALVAAAASYSGVTGRTMLNAAGDRDFGDYDFFAVREIGGGYAWVRVARYTAEPESGVGFALR
jgi:branched-chain amino acid transport system substrate-binding protein